jgi:hypothetical protein
MGAVLSWNLENYSGKKDAMIFRIFINDRTLVSFLGDVKIPPVSCWLCFLTVSHEDVILLLDVLAAIGKKDRKGNQIVAACLFHSSEMTFSDEGNTLTSSAPVTTPLTQRTDGKQVYAINGVEVNFPFRAYPSQMAMMSKVLLPPCHILLPMILCRLSKRLKCPRMQLSKVQLAQAKPWRTLISTDDETIMFINARPVDYCAQLWLGNALKFKNNIGHGLICWKRIVSNLRRPLKLVNSP